MVPRDKGTQGEYAEGATGGTETKRQLGEQLKPGVQSWDGLAHTDARGGGFKACLCPFSPQEPCMYHQALTRTM